MPNLEELRRRSASEGCGRAWGALAAGLDALRSERPAPADPERTWQRVAPLLHAWPTPARRAARRWQIVFALLPVAAVAAVGIAYLARDQREVVPAADYGWVTESPRREPWVDDPAGASTDRLWSALDLSGKPKHP